jgi:uncharacterized protein YyaL (SSP411 family)
LTSDSNRLILETSPYLLQHAHNPVDWYPWGKEALDKALKDDLPILLSIGYSACHWCHVMEHESFEIKDIADIMNKHFICIKLDREERPDIDQIYMEAVQAMGIPGGWPLNIFLTPDQEPFYGGTYFPPKQWVQLLENIASAFRQNRQALEESAAKFKETLNIGAVEKYGLNRKNTEKGILHDAIKNLTGHFDKINGGMAKAPKFPMPVIWNFLLHYCARYPEPELINHLYLTLDKMAHGGIYDQIGGGFARYSVDEKWFAPHFEKMLYDNAQLVSLFALGYSQSGSEKYRTVVYQTIEFLTREMRSQEGAFYSALDADSEGVEGKFYVWDYDEFVETVGKDGDFLVDFYGLTPEGNWESGQNILYCKESLESFATANGMDPVWLRNIVPEYQEKLMAERHKRIRPGLDNKIICGWNGLMIKALTDAYAVFSEKKFLTLALKCAGFLEQSMRVDNQLYRTYQTKKEMVPAFLEDYASVISGYLGLYQVTFDEKWLYSAQNLMSFALDNFYDQQDSLFYYTDKKSHSLIARKKELFDNVIPSSNSIMASNLLIMGSILDRKSYLDIHHKMIDRVSSLIPPDPAYMSNWATACSFSNFATAEVVIGGEQAEAHRKKLAAHFHPHKIMIGSTKESDLSLLKNRIVPNDTKIYVCYNQTCQLPTSDPEVAMQQLTY